MTCGSFVNKIIFVILYCNEVMNMFTVYKITNNINNKCYIGSSINVKQR